MDGRGLPMVVIVGPGHGGDAKIASALVEHLSVTRVGADRTTTRPDKGYSSRRILTTLGRRGIKAVIPRPPLRIANRHRRGSRRGRPPRLDPPDYRGRNVIERSFCHAKQPRGIATRYDKLAVYGGGAVLNGT